MDHIVKNCPQLKEEQEAEPQETGPKTGWEQFQKKVYKGHACCLGRLYRRKRRRI